MRALRKFSVLIFCIHSIVVFAQQPGSGISVSDYVAELGRIESAAEGRNAQEVIRQLPPQWIVKTENGVFKIDTRYIREGPAGGTGTPKLILSRIAELKQEALAFQKSPPDFQVSRKALAEILAGREFKKIHGPTAWDLYKKKIYEFLLKLLGQVLGHSAFPGISTMIIWALAAAALITLAFWIFDTLQRTARNERIAIQSSAISSRDSKDWIAEAKAAAAGGCWRDAVHLAYWAGISLLEGRGVWRPDRARTPREYLRLLPPSSDCRKPLTALTRHFEIIWYGGAEAGPDSFNEALQYLESMGWPTH